GGSGFAYTIWFGANPEEMIVKLKQPYLLNNIDILLYDNDDRYYRYYIETSLDGTNWERVVDKTTGKHQSWQKNLVQAKVIQYIKIVGTYGSVNTGFHVVELQAYYKPQTTPKYDVALDLLGANVISGKRGSALIDGVSTGYTGISGFAYTTWYGDKPEEMIVKLDQTYMLNHIDLLLWDNDNRYYRYYVETSTDGSTWSRVVDKTAGEHRSWQKDTFQTRKVEYIKIVGTYGSANTGFHAVELQAYFTPELKPEFDVALDSMGATVISGKRGENLIDGIDSGYTGSSGYAYTTLYGDKPEEMIIKLNEAYTLNHIDLLLWDNDNRYYRYYIETSSDEKNWDRVVDKTTGEHRSWQRHQFDPRKFQYIKIVGTYSSVNTGFHAVEAKAYYEELQIN
ncbi:discoidin domain-containing protein, partial [Patescibacteria group bacterium]|nr:discoidin domain-containing protein [Patescibacteria group bacterium]